MVGGMTPGNEMTQFAINILKLKKLVKMREVINCVTNFKVFLRY